LNLSFDLRVRGRALMSGSGRKSLERALAAIDAAAAVVREELVQLDDDDEGSAPSVRDGRASLRWAARDLGVSPRSILRWFADDPDICWREAGRWYVNQPLLAIRIGKARARK
jgi:hypothetical protein